jgi:hypothetical protein
MSGARSPGNTKRIPGRGIASTQQALLQGLLVLFSHLQLLSEAVLLHLHRLDLCCSLHADAL